MTISTARVLRRTALGALAPLVVGVAACGSVGDLGSSGRHDHPVVVEIADGSADAIPSTKAQARTLLRRAVDETALREGMVMADLVQADAQSTLDFSFTHRFWPGPGVPDNEALIEEDLTGQAVVVDRRDVPRAFRRPRAASGSDIIGALIAAGERLAQPDVADSPHRLLVVVSNMLNNTRGLRFTRVVLTPPRVERMLGALRRQGRIADLHGVSVAVVGAGLTRHPLPAAQQAGLRAFWHRYLSAAGATEAAWLPRMDDLPRF